GVTSRTMTERTQKKKRTQYYVSAEQFISTWREVHEANGDVNEFCKRVEMPRDIVYARASEYRQGGVQLPKLKRANAAAVRVKKPNGPLGVAEREPEPNATDRVLAMVATMSD